MTARETRLLWEADDLILATTAPKFFDDNYCLIGGHMEAQLRKSATGEILASFPTDFSHLARVVLSVDGTKLMWVSLAGSIKFLDLTTYDITELKTNSKKILLIPELFCTFSSVGATYVFTGRSYVDGSILWTAEASDLVHLQTDHEGHDMIWFGTKVSLHISLLWLRTGTITATTIPMRHNLQVIPLTQTTVVCMLNSPVGGFSLAVQIYDYVAGEIVLPWKDLAPPRQYPRSHFLVGHLIFICASEGVESGKLADMIAVYHTDALLPLAATRSAVPKPIASFTSTRRVEDVVACSSSFKVLYRRKDEQLATDSACMQPGVQSREDS